MVRTHGTGVFTEDVIVSGSLTAPTGTYGVSLTVSGVPVATGTGGGGLANTLQDAYDNGSGAIRTETGKSVVISGAANPALTVSGSQSIFGEMLVSDGAGVSNTINVTNVDRSHDLFIHTQVDEAIGIASHNSSPTIKGYRSKGTHQAPSPLTFVQSSLAFVGYGYDSGGDTYEPMGSILIWAPLAGHSAGSTPGEISFWTTPAGSVIQGLRMIISESGNVGINVGFFPTERLQVGGNILSTGEVSAVSGTFSSSLTVSGVPAATGISVSQPNLDGKVDESGDTMTGQLIFDTRTIGSGIHFLSDDGGFEVGQLGYGPFNTFRISALENSGGLGAIDLAPRADNFGTVMRDHTGLGSDWTNFATVTGGGLTYHNISVNAGANVLGLIIDDNDNVGVGVIPDSSVDLDILGDARIQSQLGIATLPNAAVQLDVSGEARISDRLGIGKLPSTSIALDVLGDAVVSNDLVASGSVGIGVDPAGGLALDVAGDASIDGNLFVNADSLIDEVQLTVRASTDQVSNVFVIEDSSAVDIFTVSGTEITASVGDGAIGNSVIEFYSGEDLKYSFGWDQSAGAVVLASGTFGDGSEVLRFPVASGIETLARINVSNLPTSSGGLESGDLWIDESADFTLKVTP